MKKSLILLLFLVLIGATPVFAVSKQKVENPSKFTIALTKYKLNKTANKIVKAKFDKDIETSNNYMSQMSKLGASKVNIKMFKPCSCNSKVKISEKTVDAKGKKCVIVEYRYLTETYQVGDCR